ncbi:chitin-binding lectin 1 [Solanum lycopersicum]|nr:chitin-binding lectin precursor [Solanum lycopersicum var. cerasiforme]
MKETLIISVLCVVTLQYLFLVSADRLSLPHNETFGMPLSSPPPHEPSPPPPYPRCGMGGGDGKCKSNECCSIWSWCGTTESFCAPQNCQSQCPHTPSPPPPSPPPPSPSPPPPSPPPPSPSPPPPTPSPPPPAPSPPPPSPPPPSPSPPPPSPPPPSPSPPPPTPSPPPPSPSPPPPTPSPPPPAPSPPPPYPRCGMGGGGGKCKSNECCSIWSWCGTTESYCAPQNCQSQCPHTPSPSPPPTPPPPYPRCGMGGGGGKCKSNECCSIWSWCGTTESYCAPQNCQSQCPHTPSPSPPPTPPPPYPRCGMGGGGGKCKSNECCSIWSWCGTTESYCAPQNCQSQCKKNIISSVMNPMNVTYGIESF